MSRSSVLADFGVSASAGAVLQIAHGSVTGDVYSATTSWTSSPLKAASNITFTPKLATSNILLIANFQAYSAATYGYYDFYKDASDIDETYNLSGLSYGLTMIDVTTSWEGKMMTFLDPVAENSTTEKTYSISARGHSASNTHIGNHATLNNQLITIMEIAA
ncbi:MAG: hypothetical protein CBE24_00630 [bacterium TMED264]|nr:MAG: hypothetical protein CBE24_00630 [bacterium TMED264]